MLPGSLLKSRACLLGVSSKNVQFSFMQLSDRFCDISAPLESILLHLNFVHFLKKPLQLSTSRIFTKQNLIQLSIADLWRVVLIREKYLTLFLKEYLAVNL